MKRYGDRGGGVKGARDMQENRGKEYWEIPQRTDTSEENGEGEGKVARYK